MHLWATGKLPYIDDSNMFSSVPNALRTIFWILAVPQVREFHFYFAHRFIHIRALYNYIHSLHHRNVDIEPFSGLSMHPVEHLYYVTSVFPSLYFLMSPLHLMWNIQHLILSPAASHSGWEDNLQGDLYHYLHHAYFECNYGTMGLPYDLFFGTFKDKLETEEVQGVEQIRGSSGKKPLSSYVPTGSLDISLRAVMPSRKQLIYNIFAFSLAVVLFARLFSYLKIEASLLGLLISVGPIFFAFLLNALEKDSFHPLWPFHRDSFLNSLFHAIISLSFCVFPVYYIVYLCAF